MDSINRDEPWRFSDGEAPVSAWRIEVHDAPTLAGGVGQAWGYRKASFGSNNPPPSPVSDRMKTLLLPVLLTFIMASRLCAQTCREVVRDSSGRIVQTIERQKQAGGTERAVIRDASGRITGTTTTRPNAGSSVRTEYRDASGRLTGTASTRPTVGTSSQTTYRDASGRMTGSADTRPSSGNGGRTQYRDASGRITGTTTTSRNPAGTVTGIRRDASGRVTGTSSGTGKCPKNVPMPLPPPSAKK